MVIYLLKAWNSGNPNGVGFSSGYTFKTLEI